MSWPHILSLSRVVAAIPVAALILAGHASGLLWAAILFGAVSLTDLLDGPLARQGRAVAPLGIYLDTTGDKVLVSVVLIAMASAHIIEAWMVMLIVGREFLVSGIRTLAAVQGFVISPNMAGKLKTTVTLIAMTLLLLAASGQSGGLIARIGHLPLMRSIAWNGMLLATVLTVWSGLRYILDTRRPLFFPHRLSTPERVRDIASHGDVDRAEPS